MGTKSVYISNSNINIYYNNYHSIITDIIIVTGNSTILMHLKFQNVITADQSTY